MTAIEIIVIGVVCLMVGMLLGAFTYHKLTFPSIREMFKRNRDLEARHLEMSRELEDLRGRNVQPPSFRSMRGQLGQ